MENSCGNCKYAFEVPDGEHCGSCSRGYVNQFTPMTNADKIRRMTDEELAEFLCVYDACVMCEHNHDAFCSTKNCNEIGITEKWLQSPEGEGDEK